MRRIFRNSLMMTITVLVLIGIDWLYGTALRDTRFFDGWVLFAGILFLVLFNARKKLPMLPLGRAAVWLQFHLYVGYFVVAAFLLHTRFTLPGGMLDWALWSLFVVVALSGVVGAYITRTTPVKLEHHSERVIFERIPAFRVGLAHEVEALAIDSVNQAGSLTISDLYASTLHDFFLCPRNLLLHLRSSRRPLMRIHGEIDNLGQYLDETQKERLMKIKGLVQAKDNLDYHYAHQGLLKAWLFIHIPATYGLIVLIVAHVAIVYAFSSGVP
jgi:hypothetical protein